MYVCRASWTHRFNGIVLVHWLGSSRHIGALRALPAASNRCQGSPYRYFLLEIASRRRHMVLPHDPALSHAQYVSDVARAALPYRQKEVVVRRCGCHTIDVVGTHKMSSCNTSRAMLKTSQYATPPSACLTRTTPLAAAKLTWTMRLTFPLTPASVRASSRIRRRPVSKATV